MVNISRAVGINAALSAFVRPEGLGHMMRAGDEGLRVYSVFQVFFFFFLRNASRHNRQVNAVWIGCELETLGLKNKAGMHIHISFFFMHVRQRRVGDGSRQVRRSSARS